MGKSHKRLNKDKINALRKEYDEFLADDKKRKHRNEFILDRLEIMRSSVYTMQMYRKDNVLNNKLIMRDPKHFNDLSIMDASKTIMRRDLICRKENEFQENNILKEISKKYILIPKVNPVIQRLPIGGVENNDEYDWRSKYSILEELKRSEISEPPEKDITPSKLEENALQPCELYNNDIQMIRNNNLDCITNRHDNDTHTQNQLSKPEQQSFDNLNIQESDDRTPSGNKTSDKKSETIVEEDELQNIILRNEEMFSTNGTVSENNQVKLHGNYNETMNENYNETIKQNDLQSSHEYNTLKRDSNVLENVNKGIRNNEVNDSIHESQIEVTDNQNLKSSNYNANTLDNKSEVLEKDITNEYAQSITIPNDAIQNKQNEINETTKEELLHLNNNLTKFENDSRSDAQYDSNQDIQTIVPPNELEDIKQDDYIQEPETIAALDEYATHINEFETEQKEMFYTDEHHTQFDNNHATDNEQYTTEDDPNAQYNYYDEHLQENQPRENLTDGAHEPTTGYEQQQYDQQYANSYDNEYHQYENQPQENYDPHNEYQAENVNFEYQQSTAHAEYNNPEIAATENTPAIGIESSAYQPNNVNLNQSDGNIRGNVVASEEDVYQKVASQKCIEQDAQETIKEQQDVNNELVTENTVESKSEHHNVLDVASAQNQVS